MENFSNPLNLLATNMCSPMVIFVVFVVVSGIALYMTRNSLNKYNSKKMETLFNVHLLHEIKMLIVLGVVIYGLCQYDQVNLAWIFLIFPVIYVIFKNILIFIPVSSANQNVPVQREVVQESKMHTQINQLSEDQKRVNNYQVQDRKNQMELPTPLVNKNIIGINGGGSGSLNGLSPPLNSITGIDSSSNMASF